MNKNKNTIKISLISPSKNFKSGVYTYTMKIKELLEENFEVTHISFKRQMPLILYPGRKRVRKELKKKKVGKAEIMNWYDIFSWKKALKKILENSNILYLPWWTIAVALPLLYIVKKAKKKNVKVIVEFHNVFDHDSFKLMKVSTRIILKEIIKNSNILITHSKKDKDKLSSIHQKGESAVIIPHMSYDFLDTKKYNKLEERKKFNIQENQIVLLMFGLVRKYKGVVYAIKAMKILKDKGFRTFLLLVGESWINKKEVLDLVVEYNIQEDFLWLDEFIPDEEIGRFFSIADIALYPYTAASQSGSMQIAFAYEVPVVASCVGGFEDLIIDQETGIFCETKNPVSLANAIENLIKSKELYDKIVENAKRNIVQRSKTENLQKKYFRIIRDLAKI
ncbi:MAG: glycosyltransferase family 4 protein [Candidatus Heimdallarchaeaceae archaeon]